MVILTAVVILTAPAVGARDLLSCIFVPVIRYSLFVVHLFVSYYSLLIAHLFCSLFDYFFCFHLNLVVVVQKEKRRILTLNSVQVFRSR